MNPFWGDDNRGGVIINVKAVSYNFPIKIVLLNHHDVYSAGIHKRQEPETPGTTSCAISHNCAFLHLAKLREVFLQRF
jgi:hypothetical protein